MSIKDNTLVPLEDKFSPFSVSTHTYKVVDKHPILADVYIPKKLLSEGIDSNKWKEKRPVVIRIHGGGLVGGQREYAPWCPAWVLELALKHDAIFVAPDYRVIPESTGEDILNDMDDFWAWIRDDLQDTVLGIAPGLNVDLGRIFVQGESAGGYLSIQLALSHTGSPSIQTSEENQSQIRVISADYPMLNLRDRYWNEDFPKPMFGAAQKPVSVIDNHLASIRSAPTRPIVTNANMEGERAELMIAIIQRGRFVELLGGDQDSAPGKRRINPEDRIIDGFKLPPTILIQGIEDSAVPVEGTDKFVELVKQHNAVNGLEKNSDLLVYVRESGDHGFDTGLHLNSTRWLVEIVVPFVEKYWLS